MIGALVLLVLAAVCGFIGFYVCQQGSSCNCPKCEMTTIKLGSSNVLLRQVVDAQGNTQLVPIEVQPAGSPMNLSALVVGGLVLAGVAAMLNIVYTRGLSQHLPRQLRV